MRRYFKAWGQNPMRPGYTFKDEAGARAWAMAEAPLSCGWAFVQDSKTGVIQLYRADTRTWS